MESPSPERPLFSSVGRSTRPKVDLGSRTLYLLIVLGLVAAGVLTAAQVRANRPLTRVEVDMTLHPEAP